MTFETLTAVINCADTGQQQMEVSGMGLVVHWSNLYDAVDDDYVFSGLLFL